MANSAAIAAMRAELTARDEAITKLQGFIQKREKDWTEYSKPLWQAESPK